MISQTPFRISALFVCCRVLGSPDAKFALYYMRHDGEWIGIYHTLSVDESMKAIQDDSWFVP